MKKLSKRSRMLIARHYRERYGLRARFVDASGEPLDEEDGKIYRVPSLRKVRTHALQEAVRWGEPYIFFVTPGVTSWVIPILEGAQLLGGVSGDEVRAVEIGEDWDEALENLVQQGASLQFARAYLEGLTVWPQAQCRVAAEYLFRLVYEVTGFSTHWLDEQRERHLQQRQIAEEIHRRKRSPERSSVMDDERLLLSLIRAGDKKGARRILNQMLGRVFLQSANLSVIRALMIEMMGYLVRRAVEENPAFEPIMEKNHAWMARIIEAEDFEGLAAVMRQALDDFMEQVYTLGHTIANPHVARAMEYIATHYTEPIGLAEVAQVTGLSTYRLAHLIKEHTGKTLLRHIHLLRVREARRLLAETTQELAAVAVETGFYDQSHFTRQFRLYTGFTPAQYRRRHKPVNA